LVYGGKSIPEVSPAYMDRRRIRDGIKAEKLKDYPKGLGWEGEFDKFHPGIQLILCPLRTCI
jgi:hypothetical protein